MEFNPAGRNDTYSKMNSKNTNSKDTTWTQKNNMSRSFYRMLESTGIDHQPDQSVRCRSQKLSCVDLHPNCIKIRRKWEHWWTKRPRSFTQCCVSQFVGRKSRRRRHFALRINIEQYSRSRTQSLSVATFLMVQQCVRTQKIVFRTPPSTSTPIRTDSTHGHILNLFENVHCITAVATVWVCVGYVRAKSNAALCMSS